MGDFPNRGVLRGGNRLSSQHAGIQRGGNGLLLRRSSDIVEGYLDLTKTYQVDEQVFEDRIARHRPQLNDIVYSREGGRLGNAARIIDREPICLGQRMMLFKVSSADRPEFLWALLESISVQVKTTRPDRWRSRTSRVNIKDLKKLVVIKPDPDLQLSFSKIVLRIDELRGRYQQHLMDLETLYGALSQKAFKGELDLSRVPLPALPAEGERNVAVAPLPPQIVEPAIHLPDTDVLPAALEIPEMRGHLLTQWLEAYRGQLGGHCRCSTSWRRRKPGWRNCTRTLTSN